jgi:hypothetical protein
MAATPIGTNKIKHLISRWVLGPAYGVMLFSLVIRSLATVVSTSFPYGAWPLALRIAVEVVAVLGMIVCSEIILSAAASSWAVIQQQIRSTLASEEYKPAPRFKGDALARQAELLNARKAEAVGRLKVDARNELIAVFAGGVISTLYGILFAATSINTLSVAAIITEVILCASLPFVVFYLSALYKPEHHNPAERAQGAAVAALDAQVEEAGRKILSGDYEQRHVDVLEAPLTDSPVHKRMLAALARPDGTVPEMTTPELYRFFGATTPSEQSSIRRVVRKTGEAKKLMPDGKLMVRWDAKEEQWRVLVTALGLLFPPDRWQATKRRTSGEQGANTQRTGGEHPANTARQGAGTPANIPAQLVPVLALDATPVSLAREEVRAQQTSQTA